jgi:hypothetical protein
MSQQYGRQLAAQLVNGWQLASARVIKAGDAGAASAFKRASARGGRRGSTTCQGEGPPNNQLLSPACDTLFIGCNRRHSLQVTPSAFYDNTPVPLSYMQISRA